MALMIATTTKNSTKAQAEKKQPLFLLARRKPFLTPLAVKKSQKSMSQFYSLVGFWVGCVGAKTCKNLILNLTKPNI